MATSSLGQIGLELQLFLLAFEFATRQDRLIITVRRFGAEFTTVLAKEKFRLDSNGKLACYTR